MSRWLNTEKVVAEKTEKPCHKLGWCPYGQLVEEFGFNDEYRCELFGHDCPAYYHRENCSEQNKEEIIKKIQKAHSQ